MEVEVKTDHARGLRGERYDSIMHMITTIADLTPGWTYHGHALPTD